MARLFDQAEQIAEKGGDSLVTAKGLLLALALSLSEGTAAVTILHGAGAAHRQWRRAGKSENPGVLSPGLGAMVAERLKLVLLKFEVAGGDIIVFVDELYTLVGARAAEGAMAGLNMPKPALARGELH
jgi:hypothetical protein